MDSQHLAPGVTLSGHLLSEEIGQGGYSRVFRAERADGTSVAVKVAVRPELVAALRSEGQVLRRLEGPRFVKILEEHLDDDPPFFVLELCPGGDLRAHLEKLPGKRLAPEKALEIFAKVCEGVAFAHDEGLVHGDLKPENVLLDAAGEPKIADLGLSRAHRRQLLDQASQLAASAPSEPSAKGGVRGTFDYLPPEVRKGAEIAPESDVFALGVLLYELVTGTRPLGLFALPGDLLAKEQIAVPRAIDRVVSRALAHDPHDRYPDAGILLRDLQAGDEGLTDQPAGKDPTSPTLNPLLLRTLEESFLDSVAQILMFSSWGAITIAAIVLGSVRAAHGHGDGVVPALWVLGVAAAATTALLLFLRGVHTVRRTMFLSSTWNALEERKR